MKILKKFPDCSSVLISGQKQKTVCLRGNDKGEIPLTPFIKGVNAGVNTFGFFLPPFRYFFMITG
jgi:hypothetical protein